ncbi:MAG: type II secretion system F family protein [Candidatus Nanopelagicales bacterium]
MSEAFEKHSNDFPPYYLGILRSAELTGNLDTVLDRLAIDIERDHESRRKLRSAMTYPAIVAVISVGTVVVLTMFVLPKFQEFFQSLDAELPAPTRLLLAISAFIQQWAWLIGLIVLVLVVAYVIRDHGLTRVARARDRAILKLPVVGSTVQVAMAERFTRVLASLVSAGVPLPQAMGVSVDSLKNLAFEEPLQEARTAMMEGAGLAGPIAVTRLFPPMAVQMIRVGEETGSLDSQLEVAAEFYERELDYKVKKLAALVGTGCHRVHGRARGFRGSGTGLCYVRHL